MKKEPILFNAISRISTFNKLRMSMESISSSPFRYSLGISTPILILSFPIFIIFIIIEISILMSSDFLLLFLTSLVFPIVCLVHVGINYLSSLWHFKKEKMSVLQFYNNKFFIDKIPIVEGVKIKSIGMGLASHGRQPWLYVKIKFSDPPIPGCTKKNYLFLEYYEFKSMKSFVAFLGMPIMKEGSNVERRISLYNKHAISSIQ